MTAPPSHSSREEQALIEIRATRISGPGSVTLVLALLAVIAVGSVLESARARRGEATAFAGGAPIPTPRIFLETWKSAGPLAANRELREGISGLEERLGRESALSAALRPSAQTALARYLGYGNSQVVVGKQGWLFFRTAFDYLTGPPFLAERELARRRTPGSTATACRSPIPCPDSRSFATSSRAVGSSSSSSPFRSRRRSTRKSSSGQASGRTATPAARGREPFFPGARPPIDRDRRAGL